MDAAARKKRISERVEARAKALDQLALDIHSRPELAFEERYLSHLLGKTGGNVSQAARDAGLDRSYLFSLLRRSGLR